MSNREMLVVVFWIFLSQVAVGDDQRGKLLIAPQELAARLDTSRVDSPIVLDVRTKDAFDKQHILGARWADTGAWRSKTFEATGLIDEAYWAKELGKLGLSPEKTIVIAGDSLPETARYWWLMRYLGFSKTQLLDGGYKAWLAESFPTIGSDAEAVGAEMTMPKIKFQDDMLATITDITSAASKRCILDNRSEAEFSGTRGIGTRTGHIPGAVHLEWTEFLDADGMFKSAEELRELLRASGVDLDDPIIAHCQTGGRSSVGVFALELVGASKVKNYYRGWSEYAGKLTAPVEK